MKKDMIKFFVDRNVREERSKLIAPKWSRRDAIRETNLRRARAEMIEKFRVTGKV